MNTDVPIRYALIAACISALIFAGPADAQPTRQAFVSVGVSNIVSPSLASGVYDVGLSVRGRGELLQRKQLRPTIAFGLSRHKGIGFSRYAMSVRGGVQGHSESFMGGAEVGVRTASLTVPGDQTFYSVLGVHGGVKVGFLRLGAEAEMTVKGRPEVALGVNVGIIVSE